LLALTDFHQFQDEATQACLAEATKWLAAVVWQQKFHAI
jgi:hypothetical protein